MKKSSRTKIQELFSLYWLDLNYGHIFRPPYSLGWLVVRMKPGSRTRISLLGHISWKFGRLERWWKEWSLTRADDSGKERSGILATPKNRASRTAAILLGCSLYLETTPIFIPCFGLMQRTNIPQNNGTGVLAEL